MSKPGAKSQVKLSEIVGRSPGLMGQWVKRSDWPVRRRGPWSAADVQKIQKWRKTLAPNPGEIPANSDALTPGEATLQQTKINLNVARTASIELKRLILKGDYRRRADIERELIQKIHAVRVGLSQLPRRLAPLLAGCEDEGEIEQVIDTETRKLADAFAGEVKRKARAVG